MLTKSKRNYADIQMIQEGNIIPENNRMAIMGLPINKSVLSIETKSALQRILYEDILTSDKVDQINVMKKLILLEKKVYNSILNKEISYYKPGNIGAKSSYKDPLRVDGIVASEIYNRMRSDDMPYINLDERNKIIKIKLDITKKNVRKIEEKFPVEYKKLIDLMNDPVLGGRLGTIALPTDAQVPDWVLEFVDYTTIINDQLKNFPLDSIGLSRVNNDSINVSNIISL